MLYDRRWERPTLQGFVDWLERQPDDVEYRWYTPNTCAWYREAPGTAGAGESSRDRNGKVTRHG